MSKQPTEEHTPVVERYGPWVALYATIGLTASGEYALAHLVGFPGLIAALLPTAIDVYVIQAMRRHRDVAGALALMVATNAIYHLAAAGLVGVDINGNASWWLIVLVSAIAPLIMWRVHRITEPKIPVTDLPAAKSAPAPVVDNTRPAAKSTPTEAPRPTPAPPTTSPPAPAPVADNTTTPADNNDRQNAVESPAPAAKKATRKAAKTARTRAGGRAPRRSMDEWVELAGPIFHSEFARRRRQPTAAEFATAIKDAGYGQVSDSTAKNIRTEILDRTDVPALDD